MKINLAAALTLGITVVLLSFQNTTSGWIASDPDRSGSCSATLTNGSVLITGGESSLGVLNRADIMGPDGSLTAAAPMFSAHADHVCVALDGGRVLVAGGKLSGGGATAAAEIYDPAKNRWSLAGSMTMPRSGATATLLNSSRVLIAGGSNSGNDLSSVEVFNPYDNVFEYSPATLSSARRNHAAAVLPDGRVLLAGGLNGVTPLDSVDIFDPVKGTVASAAKLTVARSGLSATTLLDGTVLLAGGLSKAGDVTLAELYNPAANTISVTASLAVARHGHQAIRLKNNNSVVIVGGTSNGSPASAVEQYAPWHRTFKRLGTLGSSRTPVSANGMRAQATTANGTLYGAQSYATVQTDRPDYAPGMTVKVTGSGWLPGETISLVFDEINGPDADVTYTAVADASGNFVNTQFVPDIHDLGVNFNLTATGMTSGLVAQTIFADGPANLDQCGNGSSGLEPCLNNATYSNWVNGNLGASKSKYFEGDSIPYRTIVTAVTPGTYTLTISYDTSKASKHAIDYLTSWNRNVNRGSDPCSGVTCAGPTSTFPIPADSHISTAAGQHPATQIPSNDPTPSFVLYGGTINSVGAYTLASDNNCSVPVASYTGDTTTCVSVTFTTSNPTVVLAWGGHISSRADWGNANSAVNISGSPYHTRLVSLATPTGPATLGSTDKQLSADAVIFPGTITIIKQATPEGPTAFPFSVTVPSGATAIPGFNLVDDGTSANTKSLTEGTTADKITIFGTYTITEGPTAGWVRDSIVCSMTGSGSTSVSGGTATINLDEGDLVTCTVLNHLPVAHLTVIKHVINNSGGTGVASDFTMNINGGNPSNTGFAGSETGTTVIMTPGASYNVTESGGPSGYTASYSADCSGSIADGQSKTCTVTNDDQAAKLTVIKHVINDNGGSAKASDFTMTVTGANASPASSAGKEAPGTTVTLDAGSYSVSEDGPSGYEASYSADCSGTIALGQTKTCTVTNDDVAAKLIVIKHVVNDNGGKAVASDFTMSVTGNSASPSSFPGAEAPGTTVTLNGGSFSVTESSLTGYTQSSATGCSGTIAVGETKTCTITNDDTPAKLTVIKHVVNDNGGTATAADFTMSVSGGNASPSSFPGSESGTTVTVDAGSFSVAESSLAGYTQTSAVGCSGTIAVGESKTCTITNNDVQPKLIVIKHVINDNGGTATAANFTMSVTGNSASPASFPGAEAPGTTVALNAGTFSVAESSLAGYSQKSAVGCSGSIAVGETKTCTITNDDDAPHLIVIKHVINVNGGTKVAANFSGTISGVSVAGGNTWVGAESPGVDKILTSVGSYSVTENADADYNAHYSTDCTGTIGLGQTKTCTVTNDDKAAHLIIIKNVINDNGGTKVASDFHGTITGVTGLNGNTWTGTPAPGVDVLLTSIGAFGVVETLDPDYDVSYSGCSGTIGLGETRICTVTNNDKPGKLIVKKHVVNDDGGTATASNFTMKVTGNNPSLTSFPGSESGTTVTLNAGAFSVSEVLVNGYAQTSAVGCSGTIALGQTLTCTITNDDLDPFLKVVKILVPSTDPGRFNLTIDGVHQVSAPHDPAGDGDATGFVPVMAGTHSVGETAVAPALLSDYLTTYGGACDKNGRITMALGQTATCTITNTRAGHVKVLKTVLDGPLTSIDSFQFQLRVGASTTDAGTLLETLYATGSNGGVLNFKTPLDPSKTYQMCEVVRVGWNTTLANPFTLYNASGDNSTVCTNFSVPAGETLSMAVNNTRPPGGLSRTIGYWKNWSSCTGGGQTPELDKNLPVPIGNLNITTCPVGVDILNKSDISGKKYASDPAYNMAAQLLAAALNYKAGALFCAASQQAIISGEALLQTINFIGQGPYAKVMTATQATTANTLATLLDKYNNDNVGFCFLTKVTDVPASPVFTSADNASISVSAPVPFQVTATGTPTLTLGVVGSLPTGVTFNAASGVLSVGPTAVPGVYTITFKASNFATVKQTFTLTVTP